VEVQSGSHSDKLSDKDRICELVTHNVKPDCLDKYLKATENLIGKDTQKTKQPASVPQKVTAGLPVNESTYSDCVQQIP
jgi:hypothetical protein